MRKRNLLSIARYYRAKGFSVIPLRPRDKTPLVKWTQYQCRKPLDEEVSKWFRSGQNNIAIVMGSISGICVLDFDSFEAYWQMKKRGLPEAPTVKTARGYHLYFKYSEGIRNVQNCKRLLKFDVRGDGGYIVAPPSIHPSGCQYRWVKGKSLEDLPLQEVPGWIRKELERPSSHSSQAPLRELYEGATEGERNSSLARIAGSLVRDGLTLEECMDLLLTVNERYDPPLEEEEVETIASSIFKIHHERKAPIRDVPTSRKYRMTPEERSAKLAERLREIQPTWERVKPICDAPIQR